MFKKLATLLAGAVFALSLSTMADALSINVQVGSNTTQINDGDGDGIISLINYGFGGYSITFLGGNSSLPNNPLISTLGITSFTVQKKDVNVGALTLSISDIGYFNSGETAVASFGVSALSTISGTSATFSSYLDNSNALFGTAVSLGVWGPLSLTGAGASNTITTTVTPDEEYSLTEVITINQSVSSNTNEFSQFSANTSVTPVPEPGTMVLLGAGMLGLAIFGKRRMNREA